MKRLVLIDGHAILHRAYHAFPSTLTTRKGEMVNAVYGFTRMLLSVIADLKPDYLAVAFDLPQPTFRHKEFLGYQAKRPQMDLQLKDQIARVKQVVGALNIPIFSKAGFEADDVIGTLARQADEREKPKVETMIVTGDKDILQLIKGKVKVYAPAKGFSDPTLFDKKKVAETLGVTPDQVVDYKALMGDSSDNYPGVPGIGPKTAVKLLSKYRQLDTIYSNLSKLEPRVIDKLTEGKELAYLSQKLARIVTDVPIELDLRACRVHDYDEQKVIKLFEELEFKSLINRLPGVEKEEEKNKKSSEQMKLV